MRIPTALAAATTALALLAAAFAAGAWISISHGVQVQRQQERRDASYQPCAAGEHRDCWLTADAVVVHRQFDQADAGSSSYWVTLAGGGESATEDVGETFWPLLPRGRHVEAQFLNNQLTMILFPQHEPYYADHYPAAEGGIGWYVLGFICVLFAAGCGWQAGQAALDWRDARRRYSVYR